jgi:nucleotide-binding universal stress UspA family protein
LAYDGSPKAEEALFVTTYLAQRRAVSPVVVSVKENGRTTARTLEQAREYLEAHGVEATFVHQAGAVADAIMNTANTHDCDFIVMGGYGRGPVLEVVLGSALDQVLRQSHRPTLICR